MKKIFFIFFVFFFSLKAHAIVLKNCYVSERDNKSVDTSFRKDQFEKFEFKVFSEGKIRRTQIATDEFLRLGVFEHCAMNALHHRIVVAEPVGAGEQF